jgi:multidrug resistance efflux pump
MRLFPRLFRLPSARSLAVKRFMARYIFYLEMFGFIAVSLVALAIVSCFFFSVNDVIRISGDPVAIKPRAESIKRDADSLVTRVLVRNHQPVRKGDPLIEVVEDPEWMSRYLIARQMQSLLDEFDAPGQAAALAKQRIEQAQKEAREAALAQVRKTAGPAITEVEEKKDEKKKKPTLPVVPLGDDEELARYLIAQRLADWDATETAAAPRILIRSPIDGIVVAPDDLAYKKVDAKGEILKVVDLNDLRITAKLAGQQVADARTGQQAIVKAIFPEYKNGVVFRGDTVPRGRFFWQKERVTSYGLLDPKIKDAVKETFKNRKITQRDDIPFNVTEVTDVEVDATLDTRLEGTMSGDGAGERASEGGNDGSSRARHADGFARSPGRPVARSVAYAAPAQLPTPNPQSLTPIVADAPGELELSGKVLEGTHTLTVQVADFPPSLLQQAADSVAGKIRDRVIAAPEEPEQEGGPTPTHLLRVTELRGVQVIAKVKGENADAKGPTNRLKKEAKRSAVRGASLDRLYEATVQIENPPQFLKDRVLELLDLGKDVKAKVEIKTGRRRVAFLLLKR